MRLEKMPKTINKYFRFTITITQNLLLILVAGFLSAQQTPQQLVDKMGRGINLGNVLSAPVEGNWSGAATEQYFIDVAQAGFKNVRIPIDFFGDRTSGSTSQYSESANTSFTGTRADFTVSSTYLDRLEQVIGWGLNQNLVIILDFHGATLKSEFIYTFDSSKAEYTHPSSAKRAADLAKFYAIWEQIADRFKNYSDDLIFEIINEPYFHISQTEMNALNTEAISIIRNSGGNNGTRKVIITGGTKTSYEAITTIDPQIINSDDYLIATFHYYRPFSFTKSSDYRYNVNSWGSNADKTAVDNEFDEVLNWANGFSPAAAVLLGEFGADNAYGYSYQTGDLHLVTANNSPNGTGYADGGPDPNSRADYHGYVANAAIDRGFAFSVWDAGGKSSKTIHLRKDSGLTIYDFDAFNIYSFSPKQTTQSTIIETDLWVENVKDALLNPFSARACNDTEILKNIDFECGYSTNWSFSEVGNNIQATFEDAGFATRTGSHGAKVVVNQVGNLNSAILANQTIANDGSLDNMQLKFGVHGKGSVSGLQFKLRIKYITNGANNFSASSLFTLGTNYSDNPYEFTFDVPPGTSSIQLQLICGAAVGTYYFDDFSTSEQTLSLTKQNQSFQVYPNPTNDFILIDSSFPIAKIKLVDIKGRIVLFWNKEREAYDLSILEKGIYFIKIFSENGVLYVRKIVKN
jgi:endoglucanase